MKKFFYQLLFFFNAYISLFPAEKAIEHCGLPATLNQCETPVFNNMDNLDQAKKEIIKFKKSGDWQDSNACVAEKAKEILKQYLPVGDKKLAIVFDIDDTALSNWEYVSKNHFGYTKHEFREWEKLAQASAIEPVLDLYLYAQQQGFAVFFISGRNEAQREVTQNNLRKEGFHNWNGLFLKPINFKGPSACIFKSQWREHIEKLGYTIVVNIGDQMSDLTGFPQAKHNFKVSNPMYIIP